MASEKFVIHLEAFDGGLTQSPWVGGENQYSYNSFTDHWTEPGSLVGVPNLNEVIASSSSATKATVLAVIRTSEPTREHAVLTATNSSWTLGTAKLNFDGTLSSLVAFADVYLADTNMIGRHTTPLVEYSNDLFTAKGIYVYQHTNFVSGASYVSAGPAGGSASDLIENFGYLYASYLTTSNASPGFIWRYDASVSSLITDGSAVLNPAIQLAAGWSPICMDNFGDYIAIASNQALSNDLVDWSTMSHSRIYIWDGISNTFDKKVDLRGMAVTAIHVHLGQLYAFSSSIGGIDIYRYAGGDVVQRVARVAVNNGIEATTNPDLFVPYVRKQSISSYGNRMYFGIVIDDSNYPLGNIYSFDTQTGTLDVIDIDGNRGTYTVFYDNEINLRSYQKTTGSSPGFSLAAAPFASASFSIVSSTRFAPMGKKMKINRVLVRHSYLSSTSDTIAVKLNCNVADAPRTFGATQIMAVTGSSLSVPGVGSSSAYEHAYTFQKTDGTPIPLLDSFSLTLNVASDTSIISRPRVFLPIVVEGELIDSPN